MPEYLAPGVFIEEVSYRSKSIEGVSTTTTGFVGPTRYGPVEIEPEIITNVSEFERMYGDGNQLNFGSEDGTLHNYLWHGMRAFFEEGGKRLYVSRVFRPSLDPGKTGYVRPSDDIAGDNATLSTSGEYVTDGHARVWVTKAVVAVAVSERAVGELASAIQEISAAVDAASSACEAELNKPLASQNDTLPLLRAQAVTQMLGRDTAGNETGLAKMLVLAESKATSAKTAFPPSKIDLEAIKIPLTPFRSAAADVSELKDNLSLVRVIRPAALQVKVAAADALAKLIVLGEKAVAISAVATIPSLSILKGLLVELGNNCAAAVSGPPAKPAGAAWIVYDRADTDATSANETAIKIDVTPNPPTRDAAAAAAKTALASVTACLDQMAEVKLAVENILTNAAGANISQPLSVSLATLVSDTQALLSGTSNALRAAQLSVYPRAFAMNIVSSRRADLLVELAKLQKNTTLTTIDVMAKLGSRVDALLLRARFPGTTGNTSMRLNARLGQNILVPDPGDQTKSKIRGVLVGDLVYIGQSGANVHANKLYLAYRTVDGQDWYFSQDGTVANAKFSLNNSAGTKLNPQNNEVCIVTCQIDITHTNGSGETWAGMAFQPGHTRNGAADSVTDKFSPSPKNGKDARTLPFAILLDATLKNGVQVFSALFKIDPADVISKAGWPRSATHKLTGGNDGKRPEAAEYAGSGEGPDVPKTGLKAFEDVEDISIVAAPGAMFGYMNGYQSNAQQIISSLISHAEKMKYRIAVLESGNEQSIGDVREMRARYDSKYAALYYPWIRVLDPITRDEIDLPPSGFVAGIFARNDIERAVYKAPANEVVRGAIGFEKLINKAQQEALNPEGVNCFRFFEGRGFRLWGARTISSDPEWKYVNVRRYFAYLEHSIDRGTQWAVFEPNGEALWANVRETISDFLYNEWKNGALLGTDPKSAYFVRCDRSTMTQNDLDNGRLICKIGVAALKPAEFVIFQIGQWTGDRKA